MQVEQLGGEIQSIEVSATKQTNLDKLEEAIVVQAEVLELKADPDRPADGVVIEAQLDQGRGSVATVLVQRGTLKVGDVLVGRRGVGPRASPDGRPRQRRAERRSRGSCLPIWNTLVLLRIVGREWWWILLMLIPVVGFVIWIIVALDAAKSFGRGTGFGIGLAFLPIIWYPILGFGSDRYVGPRGVAAAPATA